MLQLSTPLSVAMAAATMLVSIERRAAKQATWRRVTPFSFTNKQGILIDPSSFSVENAPLLVPNVGILSWDTTELVSAAQIADMYSGLNTTKTVNNLELSINSSDIISANAVEVNGGFADGTDQATAATYITLEVLASQVTVSGVTQSVLQNVSLSLDYTFHYIAKGILDQMRETVGLETCG